jgi:hypothetical protein
MTDELAKALRDDFRRIIYEGFCDDALSEPLLDGEPYPRWEIFDERARDAARFPALARGLAAVEKTADRLIAALTAYEKAQAASPLPAGEVERMAERLCLLGESGMQATSIIGADAASMLRAFAAEKAALAKEIAISRGNAEDNYKRVLVAQAEITTLREALEYAHANGFVWPSDPLAAHKETTNAN